MPPRNNVPQENDMAELAQLMQLAQMMQEPQQRQGQHSLAAMLQMMGMQQQQQSAQAEQAYRQRHLAETERSNRAEEAYRQTQTTAQGERLEEHDQLGWGGLAAQYGTEAVKEFLPAKLQQRMQQQQQERIKALASLATPIATKLYNQPEPLKKGEDVYTTMLSGITNGLGVKISPEEMVAMMDMIPFAGMNPGPGYSTPTTTGFTAEEVLPHLPPSWGASQAPVRARGPGGGVRAIGDLFQQLLQKAGTARY